MSQFPKLTIISPEPERKSDREKYGGLFTLAVVGLVICAGVLVVFGLGFWSMRTIWADIYLVNDAKSPEIDRINAAWRLSRDSRVNDRQKWDLALSTIPPPLARYLLAESLSGAAPSSDPRGYAHSVSRSTGLPDFLPILLARPLAYAAAGGWTLDHDSLEELSKSSNRDIAVWGLFALVTDKPTSPEILRFDEEAKTSELAKMLRAAAKFQPPLRQQELDTATLWLRENQPSCRAVWKGWRERADGIHRKVVE